MAGEGQAVTLKHRALETKGRPELLELGGAPAEVSWMFTFLLSSRSCSTWIWRRKEEGRDRGQLTPSVAPDVYLILAFTIRDPRRFQTSRYRAQAGHETSPSTHYSSFILAPCHFLPAHPFSQGWHNNPTTLYL